jgi:hypothetical protein
MTVFWRYKSRGWERAILRIGTAHLHLRRRTSTCEQSATANRERGRRTFLVVRFLQPLRLTTAL